MTPFHNGTLLSDGSMLLGRDALRQLSVAGEPVFSPLPPMTNGTRFMPPDTTCSPSDLFSAGMPSSSIPAPRLFRKTDDAEFLIFTDGCCLDNGSLVTAPRAGAGFFFRPATSPSFIPNATATGYPTTYMSLHTQGGHRMRVERRGPKGTVEAQTSNRAELRAVIAVLQFRIWSGEGFKKLVIATDSSYVVSGATEWVRGWMQNDWRTSGNAAVKNRDLWELLVEELEKAGQDGLHVAFWQIPREQNQIADGYAKAGALLEQQDEFTSCRGVMC